MTLSTTNKKRLIEAHAKIFGGIETIREGCKLYVESVDEDREAARAFMASRHVPEEFLDLMENVGRGRIHPRLMIMAGPGPERLQRAPLSEQARIINTGVEVVRLVGDEMKVVTKPVCELTRSEAEIALDSSGNTPRAQQEERLKDRLLNKTFRLPPFWLDGENVRTRADSTIPYEDLQRLAREAEQGNQAKKARLEADLKRRQIQR